MNVEKIEQHIQMMATRFVPEHMREGLAMYVVEGVMPGGFLRAVLEGDLFGALGRADEINMRLLHTYAIYLANDVPAAIYGSPGAVQRWVDHNLELISEDQA